MIGKLLKKVFRKNSSNNESKGVASSCMMGIKRNDFSRLIRELIWRKFCWLSKEFTDWIRQVDPDVIFFCGGDSGFAYNIVKYIQTITTAKLAFFLTDDYILGNTSYNPIHLIRKIYIRRKMRKCINSSDIFFTISDKMSIAYEKYFHKKSTCIVNMSEDVSESISIEDIRCFSEDGVKRFVYLGGFSYGRDQVLLQLGQALDRWNREHEDERAVLEIYSNDDSESTVKFFLTCKAILFKGRIGERDVWNKMISADYLVHVESFEKKNIEKTRYSISTKIPEYLSSKRVIVAIGPKDIASMEHLKNVAFCVNNRELISSSVWALLEDKVPYEGIIEQAYKLYKCKHDPRIVRREFERMLNSL